jgi:hypothetical protein
MLSFKARDAVTAVKASGSMLLLPGAGTGNSFIAQANILSRLLYTWQVTETHLQKR